MTKQQRSLFFFLASFLIALLLTCQQETLELGGTQEVIKQQLVNSVSHQ